MEKKVGSLIPYHSASLHARYLSCILLSLWESQSMIPLCPSEMINLSTSFYGIRLD
ncbi:hypothetical protein KIN20_014131 [Parelaphostrongylus tenuis]|uniref:Uncharacterized protein n=1 Tax=Parelaphostrongylus tenuis TaxID=148309 RepID=A0AAD5MZ29_PARTN|nr:hypothetical protein KIN20_014131 [Parelaphostrongylus tenuis]